MKNLLYDKTDKSFFIVNVKPHYFFYTYLLAISVKKFKKC